jgi:hypothetical protein
MKLRVHETSGASFRLGDRIVHFGDYRIPEDLTQEEAQVVADAGAGEFVADEPPAKKSKKVETDHLA